ncbi:peroxisomal 2,4-dienoyl-CoA reductase [(3E)-enoyl-CoA-producing], partial [Phacochoerus africanus]|uniref:peroxisomal 2,4-dienoyl-CoA reductase [(3E)-enoyl-CoA-producing] n=1 Tax=Phacochoerus africanus TaxID=41426 RepID=UPI001FD907AC
KLRCFPEQSVASCAGSVGRTRWDWLSRWWLLLPLSLSGGEAGEVPWPQSGLGVPQCSRRDSHPAGLVQSLGPLSECTAAHTVFAAGPRPCLPERHGGCPPEVPPRLLTPISSAHCAFGPRLVYLPQRPWVGGGLCLESSLLPPCCPHTCPLALQAWLPHSHRQQKSPESVDGCWKAGCCHWPDVSSVIAGRPSARDNRGSRGAGPVGVGKGAAGNFLCLASALSPNAFKAVLDTDTLGTFNMCCVLYEKFFRDHGGVIVNITATLGTRGQVLQVHAGSAKATVDAMMRHLAVEWAPQNIRVNSLALGPISGTEGFRRLGGLNAGLHAETLAGPQQRLGNKTEVAHSALFLASPLASYVTGTVLVVDGGTWMTFPNDVKIDAGGLQIGLCEALAGLQRMALFPNFGVSGGHPSHPDLRASRPHDTRLASAGGERRNVGQEEVELTASSFAPGRNLDTFTQREVM